MNLNEISPEMPGKGPRSPQKDEKAAIGIVVNEVLKKVMPPQRTLRNESEASRALLSEEKERTELEKKIRDRLTKLVEDDFDKTRKVIDEVSLWHKYRNEKVN